MKTMSKKKCFILLGLLAGLALIITPAAIIAGGGGGAKGEKPGVNCSDVDSDWQFLPPPYMGMVTVVYLEIGGGEGELFLSGDVAKMGQSECTINIPSGDPWHWTHAEYGPSVFMGLKPNDIGGSCVESFPADFFSDEIECSNNVGFLQIVGAGNAMPSNYIGLLDVGLTTYVCDDGTTRLCPSLTFNAVVMDLVKLP
jgi:hypothetical protein